MSQLTYKIAKLWGETTGKIERHEIDEELVYPEDKDLKFASNFRADLMLVKLKDEISVILTDLEVDVNFTCQLCLTDFVDTIKIESIEREFLFGKQEEIEDVSDYFQVDQKNMTIDLSEMIRQEIILHFPLIPVCSKSCKGLCQHCGKNKNKVSCTCKSKSKVTNDMYKPFKDLKKLL